MPTDPSVPSYDLDGAREISRRLDPNRSSPTPPVGAAADPEPPYTRFRAGRVLPAPRPSVDPEAEMLPAPHGATARIPTDEIARRASGSWAALLDWFLEITDADTCFVMDPQGLTAASRGLAADQGDVMGPRLMIALEQASLMQPSGDAAMAVMVEFGDRWITGVSVRTEDEARITVGIVGAEAVASDVREAIASAIRSKLAGG